MISSYLSLGFRYLKSRKKRSLLNIAGVLMSAALIAGTGTIIESVKNQMVQSAVRSEGNFHVCFRNVDERQAEIIRNHMDVERSCTGKIPGFAILAETGDAGIPYRLLRLNENDSDAMDMLSIESQIGEGRLPETPGEIAVDRTTMKILGPGYSIGSTLSLRTGKRLRSSDDSEITSHIYPLSIDENEGDPEEYFVPGSVKSWVITGVLDEDFMISRNYSSNAVTFRTTAPDRVEDGKFNMLLLLNDLSDVKAEAESIADDIKLDHSNILYNHRLLNVSGNSINDNVRRSISGFGTIVVLIIVIATIAVIYNSFNIALIERISQFGMLRCIGATPAQIRNIIMREALLVCLIAIPPGIFTGLFAMKIVFFIADRISSNPLFEGIRLMISLKVIISSSAVCALSVFVSAFIPAIRAGRLPAADAVRGAGLYAFEGEGRLKTSGRRRRAAAGFSTVMAFRNISRNRKRFLITLFSMLISVILYVSFGGMLRLVEDLYLVQQDTMPGIKLEAEAGIHKDVLKQLQTDPAVDLVIGYKTADAVITIDEAGLSSRYRSYVDALPGFNRRGAEIEIPGCRIVCYGDAALAEITNDSPGTPVPDAVLVGTNMFRNAGGVKTYAPNTNLGAGDEIGLSIGGRTLKLRLDAVVERAYYEDFNETEGGIDLLVSERLFGELTGKKCFTELYLRLKDEADKSELTAWLEQLVNTRVGYSYIDAHQQAEEMARESAAINIFFYGFIIVIALIGCLNIINTISTNLLIRAGEFGIIRAVGMDISGLRRMIFREGMIYSITALILGAVLGTGLWYLLVSELSNIRASVFRIPAREIGIAAAGLVAVTLAAGYFPLNRIRNRTIIENIRAEE